jgi:hypothetical protein
VGGRGNIYMYDRNPGPKDGSELENVPFHAKTEKQKKLQNALTDLGKKMKETHPKLREAKDNREYGYEGDMAISQLKTVARHAEHLMGMLKPDTDLPEWVQSKITLATDYLQTAHDYMMSEMNEEVKQLQEYESKGGSYKHKGKYGTEYTGKTKETRDQKDAMDLTSLNKGLTSRLEKGMGVKFGRKTYHQVQNKNHLMNVHKNLPEEVELDEKKKLPGLWANIHAKRKRGEAPAKPGDKDYPKTLNIEGVQDDPKADQMTTDDTKFPKKSRKASIVKAAAKKMPAEDQFQAKPVLDSQVAQQTNK